MIDRIPPALASAFGNDMHAFELSFQELSISGQRQYFIHQAQAGSLKSLAHGNCNISAAGIEPLKCRLRLEYPISNLCKSTVNYSCHGIKGAFVAFHIWLEIYPVLRIDAVSYTHLDVYKRQEKDRSSRLAQLSMQAIKYVILLRGASIPEKYWHPDIMNWLLFTWYKNRNLTIAYLLTLYDDYVKEKVPVVEKLRLQKNAFQFQHSVKRLVKY